MKQLGRIDPEPVEAGPIDPGAELATEEPPPAKRRRRKKSPEPEPDLKPKAKAKAKGKAKAKPTPKAPSALASFSWPQREQESASELKERVTKELRELEATGVLANAAEEEARQRAIQTKKDTRQQMFF